MDGGDDSSEVDFSSSADESVGKGKKLKKKKKKKKKKSKDKDRSDDKQGDDDDEDEPRPPPMKPVKEKDPIKLPEKILIPNLLRPDANTNIRTVKIPNIIHLEPSVYDAALYSERMEERRLENIGKHFVGDNIIRWRFKKNEQGEKIMENGVPALESNARFVEWSDGSLQLLVGEEVFDITSLETMNQFTFALTTDADSKNRCLEAQGVVDSDILIRPTSVTSAAHKEMEFKVKSKNLKSVRMMEMDILEDPEKEQNARLKAIDDRLRIQNRQRAKRGNANSSARFDKAYLEEDDGYRKSSLKRLKEDSRRSNVFDDDSDEEEELESSDEEERYRAKAQKKRAAAQENDGKRKLGEATQGKESSSVSNGGGKSNGGEAGEGSTATGEGDKTATYVMRGDDGDDDDEQVVHASKKSKKNVIMDDSSEDEL
mmetsp:Transcript_8726/g.16204  ORF Transcript_8726/g.16204 Transcript_8726/m.16204 type:complete len:429 (-) Transcript_8726:12-1298(-)